MNKDRLNGTIDELVGNAKQKTGKLIGNPSLQVKGAAQRVKGKLENTLGKAKDAVAKANHQADAPQDSRPESR